MGDITEKYSVQEKAEIALSHASGLSQQQTAEEISFSSYQQTMIWRALCWSNLFKISGDQDKPTADCPRTSNEGKYNMLALPSSQ